VPSGSPLIEEAATPTLQLAASSRSRIPKIIAASGISTVEDSGLPEMNAARHQPRFVSVVMIETVLRVVGISMTTPSGRGPTLVVVKTRS
jgi:hypothetical protein